MAAPVINPAVEAYGWTAVPRDLPTLLRTQSQASGPAKTISISSIALPDTPLVKAVYEYAKRELPIEVFNHSMRVYYYGIAILTHAFPTWNTHSFTETYILTTLLHDIGTTPANITSTLLSFEFSGALTSLSLLSSLSCPLPQAENVAETIIRHQDLGSTGTLTRIGALTHLATLFDNAGANAELVAIGTVEEVVKAWPRKGWTACFAGVVRKEIELKPWCHSTHIEWFAEIVEANEVMKPYDLLE